MLLTLVPETVSSPAPPPGALADPTPPADAVAAASVTSDDAPGAVTVTWRYTVTVLVYLGKGVVLVVV